MTTYNIYNTYQEAKIENKDSEILKARDDWQGREELIGKFIANKQDESGGKPCVGEGYFEICNPADYCMTVEQFLKDGHKFAIGDCVLDEFRYVIHLNCSVESWNRKDSIDSYRYVLRAKALEQTETAEEKEAFDAIEQPKPKHTKVEYVKVTESIFDLKEEFERGELHSKHKKKEKYYQINTETWLVSAMNNNNLYRKLATELTDREAFIEDAFNIHCRDDLHEAKEVFAVIYDELVEGK